VVRRGAIAREHELAAGLVQGVEGVEELLFGLQLVGQELDIVDEEDVGAAEAVAEAGGVVGAQGADEVAREVLDGGIADAQPVAVDLHVVADRLEEVGLSEPRRAVDEERVVGVSRHFRHRERRCVGEPIAVADHELSKRVLGVEG